MNVIETTATINPNGEIRIADPEKLPPAGDYKVVLVLDAATNGISKTTNKFAGKSFMDVAGQWVGCTQENPPDLSTNPDYMEGYGQ